MAEREAPFMVIKGDLSLVCGGRLISVGSIVANDKDARGYKPKHPS